MRSYSCSCCPCFTGPDTHRDGWRTHVSERDASIRQASDLLTHGLLQDAHRCVRICVSAYPPCLIFLSIPQPCWIFTIRARGHRQKETWSGHLVAVASKHAYTRMLPIYTGGSRAVVAVMVDGQESARDLDSHPNSQCEIRCSPVNLSHTSWLSTE